MKLINLRNHPFAVKAYFKNSTVLTYAAPIEQVEHLIPYGLQLDTFNNKWAFIAVALVQTTGLRPEGVPKFLGNDFYLIGYRVFVRYTTNKGKRLRGLYILKSETDKKKMKYLGSVFTRYNYATTDIKDESTKGSRTIRSMKSNFRVDLHDSSDSISLPENSPFSDWKEARKFAGPLPFTFSIIKERNAVLIIEGVRKNWKPEPLIIKNHYFKYLEDLNIEGLVLANAFEVKSVPYQWKKGRIEKWS